MKISFDNALIWIIPYLYITSITYYWGYWGVLDIDVYNYYAVSDLIKGMTGQLRLVLCLSVAFGINTHWSEVIVTFLLKKHLKITIAVVIIVMACIVAGQIALHNLDHHTVKREIYSSIFSRHLVYYFIAIIISIIATVGIEQILLYGWMSNNMRFTMIFLLVVLPCIAYANGRINALSILENREFEYVVIVQNTAPKGIYKYLGKAGDYQILLTRDNLRRIIAPTSSFTPLIIEKFSFSDDESILRLNASAQLIESRFQKAVVPVTPKLVHPDLAK